jgi:ABC-2 type transport system permease protein
MSVLVSEWIKLRTVSSTWWAFAGAVVLMVLAALTDGDSTSADLVAAAAPTGSFETVILVTDALSNFVVWVVLVPAILAITAEHATRLITVTVQCVPRRTGLLLGKAAVVGLASAAAGLVLAVVGTLAADLILGTYGTLTWGSTAYTLMAMGTYCAVVSVLAFGVGSLLRSTAATLVVMFLLLAVIPQLLSQLGAAWGLDLMARSAAYFPSEAGKVFLRGEDASPYGPWAGLLVMVAWAGVVLVAACWAFRRRDA